MSAPTIPPGTALAGRRLAFVLGSMELGGAERQALLLAAALPAASGAEVAVFAMTATGDGPVAVACAASGLACTALPRCESRWAWRSAWRCHATGRRLRAFRPHLLVPYTAPANLAAALGLRASGAQALVWNQCDEGLDRPAPRLERRAVRHTARFISNSSGGAAFLTALGVPGELAAVIPNAVLAPEPRADRSSWRQRLAVGADDLLVCMVAHLNAHKDHATALAAWARVCASWPGRAVLVLAGRDDGLGATLRAQAAGLGVADRVRFIGACDDIAGLHAACDLALFSSRSEGLPNAVLEAMAAGLPVAGSDIPALREALGDRATLAPPGDAAGLAAAVLALAADAGRRQRLGAALRQRAVEAFSVSNLIAASIREFAAALAGSPP